MSRRRDALPYAKREKDLAVRRIKFFCTGVGTYSHGPNLVAEYVKRDAGRVDLDTFLDGTGRTPGWQMISGRKVLLLRECRGCGVTSDPLEFHTVDDLLNRIGPGVTLRWDVATARVLDS